MTSITPPRSAAGRRVFAALLVVFALLSTSCEKKAARPPSNAAFSTFNEPRDNGGDRYSVQLVASSRALGVVGGRDYDKSPDSVNVALAAGQPDTLDTRKIIRNGSLDLLVTEVSQSIDKIGSIVVGVGGFVEKSNQTNSGGHSASVTVRVPAARLDSVIVQIKALATTVDRESVEARDVTREYIDLDARLRNAQAEEAQYLQILKRA